MKILVVESHSDIRYLVEEFLRRRLGDVEVATTASPEAAALYLQSGGFAGLVIGSTQRRSALGLSRLARNRSCFVVLFSNGLEPDALRGMASAVAYQPDFRKLIEVVCELAAKKACSQIYEGR